MTTRLESRIGARDIGDGHPCLVVAEVAQAHDGSLGMAHAFIDAVALAGADAIKFQMHYADAESSPAEPLRVPSAQDASRYDYWRRMEFTDTQWLGLRDHAAARGLLFLCSPFSLAAVDLLERCGTPAWKVGSGEIVHTQLLRRMARTGLPVLLSTGMATWEELGAAVAVVREYAAPLVLLQCASMYPTPPQYVGVQLLADIRRRFDCLVGLSDHSGTPYPALAAAVLGACMIEVHVTLSRQMYGPDVTSSVTTTELGDLCRGVRFVHEMLRQTPDKNAIATALAPMRAAFFRSIVAERPIPAGAVIGTADVALKKPGNGLPPSALAHVIGARAARDIRQHSLIAPEDVETLASAVSGSTS